jgi:branched-chain amino acid aminotransferase
MEHFNYNGKIYKNESTVISVDNRGLRYGDGLFETLKSENSILQFLDDHFARLWKGINLLEINIPKHFTPDFLQNQIIELLKKNGHRKIARVRLTVFRGEGGLYDELKNTPGYLIQSWAMPDGTGTWNSNGLVLGIYPDVRKSCDLLSNLKQNNFLPYVLAAIHAKKQKWNDAVLLNTESRLCDTTIANIFLIKDKVIYTPALQEGCIAGVMRKNVITHLRDTSDKLVETQLSINYLLEADEVFLTNSVYNMRWVQCIGDKKYTNLQSQKIYSDVFSTNS